LVEEYSGASNQIILYEDKKRNHTMLKQEDTWTMG